MRSSYLRISGLDFKLSFGFVGVRSFGLVGFRGLGFGTLGFWVYVLGLGALGFCALVLRVWGND